jgi:hypothetical protein
VGSCLDCLLTQFDLQIANALGLYGEETDTALAVELSLDFGQQQQRQQQQHAPNDAIHMWVFLLQSTVKM